MERPALDGRQVIDTTTTMVLAFLGCIVVVFPTAALVDGVVGSPLGAGVVGLSTAIGLLGAVLFVHRELSTTRLWRFIGIAVLTGLAWLILVGAGMSLTGTAIHAGDRRPFLYAWLLALATGYTTVYADFVDVPTLAKEGSLTDDSA